MTGNAISLLAKWIKTADASSANTRKLGVMTAQKLGYSVYEFKRLVRAMRKQIGIVEALMSAGRWDEIRYSAVPSRAMMIYRNAFMKHDEDRYGEFIKKAVGGAVADELQPIRDEFKRLAGEKAYLDGLFARGAETAERISQRTLIKVKKKVGLILP